MKNSLLLCLLALLCASCTKTVDDLAEKVISKPGVNAPVLQQTTLYTIKKGEHSCDKSTLKLVDTTTLRFAVRFDSSAVYVSQSPVNQYDINKLYGFSDNGAQHHQFSARFGWRWSEGALRLFAYVYNNGVRQERELGVVSIGAWTECSITASGKEYLFSLNGTTTAMPRASATPKASGYLLYPYFGGDEVAPHDVRIEIRNQ